MKNLKMPGRLNFVDSYLFLTEFGFRQMLCLIVGVYLLERLAKLLFSFSYR